MIRRRATTLFRLGTSILLAAAAWPLAAAPPPTRPVSVGVVANYEHNLARSANLGWSRMDISWKEIQPTPSAWNIGPTNDRVNLARANGQQVLAILHNVPSWLTTPSPARAESRKRTNTDSSMSGGLDSKSAASPLAPALLALHQIRAL